MRKARPLNTPENRQAHAEFSELLRELDSEGLVEQARKRDVYLDDIPSEPIDPDHPLEHEGGHFEYGQFGSYYLKQESLNLLRKAVRDREPIYRRERREVWQLWISLLATLTGIVGALSGLVALWKK